MIESERLALVGKFAASIAHDLKNPLNIIGLSAEMACDSSSSVEARKQAAVRIRKQVDRISDVLNELVEFTQESKAAYVLAEVSYKNFVERLVEELQQEFAGKSVRIQYNNPPPQTFLRINPKRLARVFYNIIANSADAMAALGGGTVRLSFRQDASEVVTEFEDTGKGISPEMADKMFIPFASWGKSNGTGLGLAICNKIVQDHGGLMYARNVFGGGALVGFSIPVTHPPERS